MAATLADALEAIKRRLDRLDRDSTNLPQPVQPAGALATRADMLALADLLRDLAEGVGTDGTLKKIPAEIADLRQSLERRLDRVAERTEPPWSRGISEQLSDVLAQLKEFTSRKEVGDDLASRFASLDLHLAALSAALERRSQPDPALASFLVEAREMVASSTAGAERAARSAIQEALKAEVERMHTLRESSEVQTQRRLDRIERTLETALAAGAQPPHPEPPPTRRLEAALRKLHSALLGGPSTDALREAGHPGSSPNWDGGAIRTTFIAAARRSTQGQGRSDLRILDLGVDAPAEQNRSG